MSNIVIQYRVFAVTDRNLLDGVSLDSNGINEYSRYITALEYLETFDTHTEALAGLERLAELKSLDADYGFIILPTYKLARS
jgi:hypothetical protein